MEWERYSTRRNHEVIREGDPWLIKQDVYYNDRLEKVESHYPDVDERNTGE